MRIKKVPRREDEDEFNALVFEYTRIALQYLLPAYEHERRPHLTRPARKEVKSEMKEVTREVPFAPPPPKVTLNYHVTSYYNSRYNVIEKGRYTMLKWCYTPSITVQEERKLRNLLSKASSQVQVATKTDALPPDVYHALFRCLLKVLKKDKNETRRLLHKVIRQLQKGKAEKNLKKLTGKKRGEIRHRVFEGGEEVESLASELNVSVADLGTVLSSREELAAAVVVVEEEESSSGSSSDEGEESQGDEVEGEEEGSSLSPPRSRLEIAKSIVVAAKDDRISGFKVLPSVRKVIKKVGDDGENLVLRALEMAKVPFSTFSTENQLKTVCARGTPTPDFLFHENVCMEVLSAPEWASTYNCDVKWIDAKNCFLIPGVSAEKEMKRLLRQMTRYCDLYGPGVIVWLQGFLPGMVKAMAHLPVTHVWQHPVAEDLKDRD